MPINMSHCRHHNTLLAVQELVDDLDSKADLSDGERRARDSLLVLCKRIADDFESEISEIETQRRRGRAQGKRPRPASAT